MDQFQVGDEVTWSSKVEGEAPIQRSGFVAIAVPPGKDPLEYAPKGFSLKGIDNKNKRDHESYIVQVGRRVFWPPTGKLRRVKED